MGEEIGSRTKRKYKNTSFYVDQDYKTVVGK